MAGVLIFWLVAWVAAIFVGRSIGSKKGRAGGWWGFWLGWLGVIIVACLSDKNPQNVALTGKQREVAELEADVKLAELRQRQAALAASGAPVETVAAE